MSVPIPTPVSGILPRASHVHLTGHAQPNLALNFGVGSCFALLVKRKVCSFLGFSSSRMSLHRLAPPLINLEALAVLRELVSKFMSTMFSEVGIGSSILGVLGGHQTDISVN